MRTSLYSAALLLLILSGCGAETIYVKYIDNQSSDTLTFTFPDSSVTSFGSIITVLPGENKDMLLTFVNGKDLGLSCKLSGDSVQVGTTSGRILIRSMHDENDWIRLATQKPNQVHCTFSITESDLQ